MRRSRRDNPWIMGLHRRAWRSLALGLPLALVLVNWTCLGNLVMPLPVIIHELGHGVAAWSFGVPAVPAFDFRYGGGVTIHYKQWVPLLLVPYALMAYLAYLARGRAVMVAWVLVLAAAYSMLAWTNGWQVVVEAMGHGFELLFAAVFFFRAMTGFGVKVPAERPLYAMLGFWFDFHNIRFAHNLMTDAPARQAYADAKGGGDWMDFAQISRDLSLDFNTTVATYMLCCVMVIPVAYFVATTWLTRPKARAVEMRSNDEVWQDGLHD